jgi:hypothetical protein
MTFSGVSSVGLPSIWTSSFSFLIYAPRDLQAVRVASVSLASNTFLIIDSPEVNDPIAIAL